MKSGFMAGCALSSYSPYAVKETALYLRSRIGNFAVMQKCCGKPTKLTGQKDLFRKRYADFSEQLSDIKVDRLIVACPGCMNTILSNKNSFEIISLWEFLAESGLPGDAKLKAENSGITVSVHDSCATRYNKKLQDSIRYILREMGYKISECENEYENTFCCGFGGMVGASNTNIAKKNAEKCIRNYSGNKIVTYCASCCSAMNFGGGQAWHILDLIWGGVLDDETAINNSLSYPIKAWINRYKAKQLLKNI